MRIETSFVATGTRLTELNNGRLCEVRPHPPWGRSRVQVGRVYRVTPHTKLIHCNCLLSGCFDGMSGIYYYYCLFELYFIRLRSLIFHLVGYVLRVVYL